MPEPDSPDKPLDGPDKPLENASEPVPRQCQNFANCGNWLNANKRKHAKFCSDACRYNYWMKENYGTESDRTAARKASS